MAVMLPPGQGVTVTVPTSQAAPPATTIQTQPPNPFRPARGPDVLLMPHQPEQQQPQPRQFSRRGWSIQLSGILPQDVAAFANAMSVPHDDAPHHVFADYLEERGDPRSEIVRRAIPQGRDSRGSIAAHPDWFTGRSTGSYYTPEGGWTNFLTHPADPNTHFVRYIPRIKTWQDNTTAPDYVVPVNTEERARIENHVRSIGQPMPYLDHTPT